MGAGSFTLDTRDFDIGFEKFTEKTIPKNAESGMLRAGAVVIKDTIMEEPRAPHKTGHLWRSQLILAPERKPGEIFLFLGFNVPYAAPLHESPVELDWTMEGSGTKFLESKLLRNAKKYLGIIANKLFG